MRVDSLRPKDNPRIFYLCDREKECKRSITCGNGKDHCNHTTDSEHARNGMCDNPEKSDRFELTERGDYWEKE